ncbi:MAG: NAD(P)/FAD-dependent oxidoreductase, partial [Pseudonocardiaceae bacterium]
YRLPSGRLPVCTLGIEIQNVRRTTLERVIRHRVLADRRVELRTGFVVDGLELDEAGRTVIGVAGRRRDTAGPTGPSREPGLRERISADLVVDASGQAANLSRWLAETGWERPELLEVDGRVTYVSRFYRLPAGHTFDWYGVGSITYAPHINRGGGVFMTDGDCLLVTLIGAGGEVPPTDEAGFLAYATSLDMAEISAVITAGTPLTPAYRYARMSNRWNCYHRLRHWPQRLIAMGDAVCVFNPLYGQGLTIAAQEAQLLGEMLEDTRTLTGLAPRFQRRVGSLIRLPWTLATSSDLFWDPAPPGRSARLTRWYLNHLLDLLPTDPDVATRFLRVQNMISKPTVLATPRVITKVLRQSRATPP